MKIKGLIAPVIGIQVFNNSWATTYSKTFTNSPDSVIVSPLAAGTYRVKVTFYTSSWSAICDKMIDAVVTAGTTAPSTERSQTLATDPGVERINAPIARTITVAPNPFVNSVWVTIGSNKNENASIIIMDLTGRPIVKKAVTLQKGVNQFSFDELSRYPTGSYLLRLATSEGVQNIRLLKQ
jgi:hypothetical protein